MTVLTENNEELRKQLENYQTKPVEKPEENCKKLENKKVLIELNWIVSRIEELEKLNKSLKDRNDELEYCLLYRTERGRTRKRGRRTSRWQPFWAFLMNINPSPPPSLVCRWARKGRIDLVGKVRLSTPAPLRGRWAHWRTVKRSLCWTHPGERNSGRVPMDSLIRTLTRH